MAFRAQSITAPPFSPGPSSLSFATRSGLRLAVLLLGLGLLAILTLVWFGGGFGDLPQRTGGIIRSAAVQAGLSTLFSGVFALPGAVMLNRYRHAVPVRLMRLVLGLAMVTPTTVAAIGLLEIWGRNGMIALVCSLLAGDGTCDGVSIYGLHGVVLAHMFFNIPLLIWIMLPLLEAIPRGQWRVARHLGFDRWADFRFVEFPAMRQGLMGGLVLVFLLCFTSFALVLMLGGGPKVTTLEVEIYAAIRFSFDFRTAASLSLMQFAIAACVVLIRAYFIRGRKITLSGEAEISQPPLPGQRVTLWDGGVYAMLIALILLPMIMVVIGGIGGNFIKAISQRDFIPVTRTSIAVAVTSGVITLILALILASTRARIAADRHAPRWQVMLIDSGVMLYLVIPSIVLGTAAFILLRQYGDVFRFAFAVVVLANSLLALPLATRLLEPRIVQTYHRHDRIARMLDISGWQRMRLLTMPVLHREMGQVLGLAAALSVGDLGVIALFASNDFRTLPWLLYQMAGSYRVDIAASLALILLMITMLLLLAGQTAGRITGTILNTKIKSHA